MAGIPIGILHNSTIPVELFGDACDILRLQKKSEQTHGPMENIAATRVRIGSCWPQSWCFQGEGNGQFMATCPQRKEVAILGST